ncbi:NADH dehydrogenase [Cupriavidus taiwanensis]|uniref:NADH dehydrogenase n=1 Tax=Cupriavidus taiwanensis TaxID=164546 RepID=A0A975ZYK3_9BURK|nr:NAD(P)/FAD-dependent oxidoreductase [Cupriavidus taiwanensis]SOY46104.1 NADH dehydrogenase [Cupriavidus taiwanensis]
MKTIVIIGGGTAGLQLAARLGKQLGKRGLANIVLVDRYRTHLWKPLLHEVATGKLEPYIHHTSFALQARRYGFRFVQGEFTSLDRDNRTLEITASGSDGDVQATTLAYDTLVLAIGGTTQYFGVPGASEHALALDSVAGAEYARTQIVDALRRVSSQAKAADRPARASVAIVGAGATGVQLAAQVRQMSRVLSQYGIHSLDPDRGTEVLLVEASGNILPGMDRRLAERTTAELQAQGIQILLNTRVTEVRPDCLHIAGAAPVAADVTVWTAGVTVAPVLSNIGLQVTRNGRVRVGDRLQTLEDEHIYALGDCASFRPAGEQTELPTRAQVAHQQAIYLARALPRVIAGKSVAGFTFRDRGSVISLADDMALCHLLAPGAGDGWQVQGVLATLVHRVIYRRHVLSVQGFARTAAMALSQRLERLLGAGYRLD